MTECPNCLTPWKCNGPHMTDDLPPPEPHLKLMWRDGQYRVSRANVDWMDCYTADQMRAYGDARAAAAVLAYRPTGGAPCARHCEATAFGIEIRSLKRQLAESEARAAAERERCATVCDDLENSCLAAQKGPPDKLANVMMRQIAVLGYAEAAAAIRRNDAGSV